jgi:23S rRNA (adenine2503-C2)-methyltransferase
MSDLAKSLREKLKGTAHLQALSVISQHESADGTIKWLFDVGAATPSRAFSSPKMIAARCAFSSQAGCAVGCRFCSTGHQGFSRNLTTG